MKVFILLWNIIQVSRNQGMDIFGTSAWNMDIFGISSSLNLKMSSSKGKASRYNTNHVGKMWAWGILALFKINTGSDFSHFRRRSTSQIPTKNALISNTKLHLHWDNVLSGDMQTERISISWVCKPIFKISVSIGVINFMVLVRCVCFTKIMLLEKLIHYIGDSIKIWGFKFTINV